YNNGDGTLQPRVTMEGNGSQETALVAADANEDGILDLFLGAHGSGEMIILLGDGDGGLVFSSKLSAGGSPWMIAAGDVNGDGHVDVVSANSFANNAAVILGDGMGGMLPAVTYPTGNFCLAIDLGDIDGDGDLDMMTSNYSSGTWTIYENDGTGVFINPRTVDATSAGSCATLHDRDNDGDLDITGIDEVSDQIFIFENDAATSVAVSDDLPGEFRLEQNYPNPFNPSTAIRFRLSAEGHVSLKVFDLLGREISTLVSERLGAGSYEVTFDAGDLPSGVYYYRLKQGESERTKKLLLAK
ncbi:MAG: T9SS type A sorting domain-containing protein, partial [Ignavibacteria bacterium]|nr:T9SS type A sorting domain-containing protein [Ignavibacteria bacterium]